MPVNVNKRKKTKTTPEKLKLLCLIVNRQKAEFFVDFLQGFDVNLELITTARGTASLQTLHLLGLEETEKTLITAVIREKRSSEIMERLNEKFKTLKNGKGIAFTIPFGSIIGLSSYRFLSNNRMNMEE